MQQPGVPSGRRPPTAEREARVKADAIDVLRDVLGWELALPRWQEVERIVASIEAALTVADVDAVRDATVDLKLLGPVRITRIGATPQLPVPDPVRERTNHLIHSLGGASPATPTDTSAQGAEDDHSPGR